MLDRRRLVVAILLSMAFAVTGCSGNAGGTETPQQAEPVQSDSEPVQSDSIDASEPVASADDQVIEDEDSTLTEEPEISEDAPAQETPVEAAQDDEKLATVEDEPDASEVIGSEVALAPTPEDAEDRKPLVYSLSDQQLNSVALVNYLTVTVSKVNELKENRLQLEAIKNSIYDNTYPNAVDEDTKEQINSIVGTINAYGMIGQKRERLEYIHEREQARAIRDALPSPAALISAAVTGNKAKLALTVLYMAMDSYTSYRDAVEAADLEYLMDSWELDDAGTNAFNACKNELFGYQVDMANSYDVPGELTLNEPAVNDLVSKGNNTNVVRRLQFLESSEETYQAYGGFWLTLAKSYFENEQYSECVDAINTYESVQARIFRKDYEYAKALPLALYAASEVMDGNEFISYASERCARIVDNTDSDNWELRYYAAITYLDLYQRTGEEDYLKYAYSIALNNVNSLIDEQRQANDEYLKPITEVKHDKGETKARKKEIDNYNKARKEERKLELPPVSEPLLLNCDLLFALAEKLDIPKDEQERIDYMLHGDEKPLFLTSALNEAYTFTKGEAYGVEGDVKFDGTTLSIPAGMISSNTTIEETVGGKAVSGEWTVEEVKRGKKGTLEDISVKLKNKEAKGSYSDGDNVVFTLTDMVGDKAITRTVTFRAKTDERLWIIPDGIDFELVA